MVKTFMEVDHNSNEPGGKSDLTDPTSEEMQTLKEDDALTEPSAVLEIDMGKAEEGPKPSPRFEGLAQMIDTSLRSIQSASSALLHMTFAKISEPDAPFVVSSKDLSELCAERTHQALARLLSKAASALPASAPGEEETLKNNRKQIEALVKRIGTEDEDNDRRKSLSGDSNEAIQRRHDMEMAANALATVVLRSKPEEGISNEASDIELRKNTFGSNAIAEKKLDSFLKLCWNAVQDFVLIMLIALGVIGILVETTIGLEEGEQCGHCWLEGAAILASVCIVVLVTAGIDYAKQFAFVRLTRSLNDSNTKMVIRDGQQISVTDDEIVVGDILSVNAHNLASIPADCVVLGPSMSGGLKMDESALTGESVLISKHPGDIVLSGTTTIQGSAKMVVIAVGTNSVAGKIQAHVYESSDHDADGLDGDEDSPLFVKLEKIAKQIGIAGTCAAALSLAVNCIKGFAFGDEDPKSALIEYFVTAITVLAVAGKCHIMFVVKMILDHSHLHQHNLKFTVPEGLPLAVTLALAYSSNKMMKEQNLVKHLDACETMGCATTICTDKTGTLTANKMTTRAIYTTKTDFSCNDPAVTLGDHVKSDPHSPSDETILLIATLIAVDTMDETTVTFDGDKLIDSTGNPTEVALAVLVHHLGHDCQKIRDSTRGRSDKGELAEFLVEGKQIGFSSARKMMSWAVPKEGGGYRIYCKGATEVLLTRCTHELVQNISGDTNVEMNNESRQDILNVAETYAKRGMRTLGLAYRDISGDNVDFNAKSETLLNSDGSEALSVETGLVFVALVGIEDPLRQEVPDAIEKCYNAGIDVRLVTGDSEMTAVSIAYQAGILKDFHFVDPNAEKIAHNLKPNVLMEGKQFRRKIYRIDEDGNKEFDQTAFDTIWPHLRVLARSSPDDKLSLAHGLNQSMLFTDKKICKQLKKQDNITIFPDRQVVAMTGDGTNDAPALKRADIGFAMGISGTQVSSTSNTQSFVFVCYLDPHPNEFAFL